MIELIPAYGRKYKSMKEAMVDWKDGKDFQVFNGPMCSIRNLDLMINDFDRVILVVNDERKTLGTNIWGDIL